MSGRTCDIRKVTGRIDDVEGFLAQVRKVAEDHAVSIVLLDADSLVGAAHVRSALCHAFRAWREMTRISNSLEMEVLLYAAGSRQCSVAMRFGVHQGWNRMYLCICPPDHRAWERLQTVVSEVQEDWELIDDEKSARLAELFSITKEEIAVVGRDRLQDLVLERVALLEVNR